MLSYVIFDVFGHFELRATTFNPPSSPKSYDHSVLIRVFDTFEEAETFYRSNKVSTLYSLIHR